MAVLFGVLVVSKMWQRLGTSKTLLALCAPWLFMGALCDYDRAHGIINPRQYNPQEYTIDLTQRVLQQEDAGFIDVDGRIGTLLRSLSREDISVLLIGPPGVGKTSAMLEVARRVANGRAGALNGSRVWLIDLPALSGLLGADITYTKLGAWLNLIRRAVEYGRRQDPNSLFFIDELQTILRGGSDEADTLKNFLEGQRIVGITTAREWAEAFPKKDRAFGRRLKKVRMSQPRYKAAFRLISRIAKRIEQQNGVTVPPTLVRQVVDTAVAHVHWVALPGGAVAMLEDAVNRAKEAGRNRVTEQDVDQVLANWARVLPEDIPAMKQDALELSSRSLNAILRDKNEIDRTLIHEREANFQRQITKLRRKIRDGLAEGSYPPAETVGEE